MTGGNPEPQADVEAARLSTVERVRELLEDDACWLEHDDIPPDFSLDAASIVLWREIDRALAAARAEGYAAGVREERERCARIVKYWPEIDLDRRTVAAALREEPK